MTRWRQFIAVRGNALRVLESASNISATDQSNTVVVRGHGDYFPEIHGPDWAAMCAPLDHTEIALDDIRPYLDLLMRDAPIAVTDAPIDEAVRLMWVAK